MTKNKKFLVCEMLFIDDHRLNSRIVIMPTDTRIEVSRPEAVPNEKEKATVTIIDSKSRILHKEFHEIVASANISELKLAYYMKKQGFISSKNIPMQEIKIT